MAVTDLDKVRDPDKLPINRKRIVFYERFGARVIEGTGWDKQPNLRNGNYLTHLLFHPLGTTTRLRRSLARAAARRVLSTQYGYATDDPFVERIVRSFVDDPVRLRAPLQPPVPPTKVPAAGATRRRRVKPIPVVVSEGHQIHHLHERGYVERPVRVRQVLRGLVDCQLR